MSAEQSIEVRAQQHYESRFDSEMRELIALVDDYDSERYEEALEELEQMPLSFQKLTTHHVEETIVWEILLGTGGPADRVLVTTGLQGMIESAEYQFQDWFEPWTAAPSQDSKLVQRFAEIVGYYEDES